jgi:hypothetical protein
MGPDGKYLGGDLYISGVGAKSSSVNHLFP